MSINMSPISLSKNYSKKSEEEKSIVEKFNRLPGDQVNPVIWPTLLRGVKRRARPEGAKENTQAASSSLFGRKVGSRKALVPLEHDAIRLPAGVNRLKNRPSSASTSLIKSGKGLQKGSKEESPIGPAKLGQHRGSIIIMLLNIILLFTYMPSWLTLARAQQTTTGASNHLSSLALNGPALAAAAQQQQHQQHLTEVLLNQINTAVAQQQQAANQRQQQAPATAMPSLPSTSTSSTTAPHQQASLNDLSPSPSNLLPSQYLNSLTGRSFHHANHNYAPSQPSSSNNAGSSNSALLASGTSSTPSYALYPSLAAAASSAISSTSSSPSTGASGSGSSASGGQANQSALQSLSSSLYPANHQYPGASSTSAQPAGNQAAAAAHSAALLNLLYNSGLYPQLASASSNSFGSPLYGGSGSPSAPAAANSPIYAQSLLSGGAYLPGLGRASSLSPYGGYYASSKYPSLGGSNYLAALQSAYSPSYYSAGESSSTDGYSSMFRQSPYAALFGRSALGSAGSALDASATSYSPYSSLYSSLAGGAGGSASGLGSYGSYLGGGGAGSANPYASLYASLYGSGASGSESPYSAYSPYSGASSAYAPTASASSSPYSSLYSSSAFGGVGAGAGSPGASSAYSSLYAAPSSLSSLYSSLYGGGGGAGASGGGSTGAGYGGSSYGGSSYGSGGLGYTPRISISPLFGSGSQSHYSYLNPYSSAGYGGAGKSSLLGGSSLWGGKLGLGLGLAGLSLLG